MRAEPLPLTLLIRVRPNKQKGRFVWVAEIPCDDSRGKVRHTLAIRAVPPKPAIRAAMPHHLFPVIVISSKIPVTWRNQDREPGALCGCVATCRARSPEACNRDIKDRIVAAMGGSLGGNMSLLLSSENDDTHAYLNTIVAWSPTCAIPSSSYDILSHGLLAAYYSGLKDQATSPEAPGMADYISNIHDHPLNPGPPSSLPPFIPPQPRMWYRGALLNEFATRADSSEMSAAPSLS